MATRKKSTAGSDSPVPIGPPANAAEVAARLAIAIPEPRCELEHQDAWQLLIATILPATNAYGDPTQITWAGQNGHNYSTNRSKCATLVTQLLEKAYDPDFVSWFGCTSPHAASYHDAIEVEDGFTLIESIHDVRPGDIIAIQYLDAGCRSCRSSTVDAARSAANPCR